MAKRGVAWRGRSVVAVALLGFLVVASSVVWRRSRGSEAARRLHALGAQEAGLAAERARLESEIGSLTSRVRLQPIAERLGMRVPSDSQVILLERPKAVER